MRIAVSILAVLFGSLHIIAAVAQFKSEASAARGAASLMLCGGMLLISSAAAHLVGSSGDWMIALSAGVCGFLPICFAAYLNGRRSGKVHVSHHLVRGGIAVLLVLGFFLW